MKAGSYDASAGSVRLGEQHSTKEMFRHMRSGKTWRSGCSTTPASIALAGTKKTGAGRRSRIRNCPRSVDPIILGLDVRMARIITLRPDRAATVRLWRKSSARHARRGQREKRLSNKPTSCFAKSWNERMWSDW